MTTIKLRHDISSNWTSANPVLASGELGIETDTNKMKVGDGTTAWADLGYISGSDETVISYTNVTDKPSINGVTLAGNKTTSDLGIDIPTKVSELTNDSGYTTNTGTVTSVNNTSPDTNGNVTIDIPDEYTLPTATSSTLGGIKVGDNLSITSDGVLSANATEVTVDTELSTTSTNPIANLTVTQNINNLESSIESLNTTVSGKADKATTLSGYGITDAYTKTETDALIPDISNLATKTELEAKQDAGDYATNTALTEGLAGKQDSLTTDQLSAVNSGITSDDVTLISTLDTEMAAAQADIITLQSTATTQGNTFNGASQLVQLDTDGKLPALDGSALTGITADAPSNMVTTDTKQTITGTKNFNYATFSTRIDTPKINGGQLLDTSKIFTESLLGYNYGVQYTLRVGSSTVTPIRDFSEQTFQMKLNFTLSNFSYTGLTTSFLSSSGTVLSSNDESKVPAYPFLGKPIAKIGYTASIVEGDEIDLSGFSAYDNGTKVEFHLFNDDQSELDYSKFTVVGSPTITDDGIMTNYDYQNYIYVDLSNVFTSTSSATTTRYITSPYYTVSNASLNSKYSLFSIDNQGYLRDLDLQSGATVNGSNILTASIVSSISALDSSATLSDVITAYNNLLTALKAG